MAPPGTRAVVYKDPTTRTSWGTKGIDGWYCGPALDHYRNCRFYIPETGAYRTSGSYDLFPQHCLLPDLSPVQHAEAVHDELVEAIRNLPNSKRKHILTKALKELCVVRDETGRKNPKQRDNKTAQTPTVTTTNDPTSRRNLLQKPRTHARRTRANEPHKTQLIRREPDGPRRSTRLNPTMQPRDKPAGNAQGIPYLRPRRYPRHALNLLITNEFLQGSRKLWTPRRLETTTCAQSEQATHFCAPVIHPSTGEVITQYKKLAKDPTLRDVWTTAFGKEFGNLAQGDARTGTKGTDAIFVMDPKEIHKIPHDRTITYAKIVVAYRPQKDDPNRVRITAGGNLLTYPGELSTRVADLTTTKLLWNSVLSTKGARFMGIDIKNFYLGTPMDRYQYMKMPLSIFPPHVIQQYDLQRKSKNGFVYIEIRKAIYGLPEAGRLANHQLRDKLTPFGYYEVAHTPGLWKHVTRPIQFTLVVDDFGVKYVGRENAEHLIKSLNAAGYEVSTDWTGDLYCGITLKWDYTLRTLTIAMPGYIRKLLNRYKHECPKNPVHNPYRPPPRIYGKESQAPAAEDTTKHLDKDGIRNIQRIVGAVLYYARAIDCTVLAGLSSIGSDQAKATELTKERAEHLLDYLATHPDSEVKFYASEMILNIHSDASYLSESRARSRTAGYFFLGSTPLDDKPIALNGNILVTSTILKYVVASASEAELAALFMNVKEGKVMRLALEELGHPQPPTPVHCDNKTATAIANDTIKKQRSRSMEMRYFWVTDQVNQGYFDVRWHPGQENLADYPSKHHFTAHHRVVRPYYTHSRNSPRYLPRASAPSAMRGCAGTLDNGYVRTAPLPRISK